MNELNNVAVPEIMSSSPSLTVSETPGLLNAKYSLASEMSELPVNSSVNETDTRIFRLDADSLTTAGTLTVGPCVSSSSTVKSANASACCQKASPEKFAEIALLTVPGILPANGAAGVHAKSPVDALDVVEHVSSASKMLL